MTLPRQLALALPHAESFAREDFLEGASNAAALRLIEQWPDWPDRVLALVGPEGAGKSHLAAIWAEIAGARRVSARALGGTNLIAELATAALVVEDAGEEFDERAPLDPPDDPLLRAVMVKLFADRQLAVDESLIGYLVARIERSFAGARAAVDDLDREALRQQRPVTRALAAELMAREA